LKLASETIMTTIAIRIDDREHPTGGIVRCTVSRISGEFQLVQIQADSLPINRRRHGINAYFSLDFSPAAYRRLSR
jgi:hypothetical protein